MVSVHTELEPVTPFNTRTSSQWQALSCDRAGRKGFVQVGERERERELKRRRTQGETGHHLATA